MNLKIPLIPSQQSVKSQTAKKSGFDICIGLAASADSPALAGGAMARRILSNPPLVHGLARQLIAGV
jgi:hypothetical protein